jgi:hypothetical protein
LLAVTKFMPNIQLLVQIYVSICHSLLSYNVDEKCY